MTTDALTSETPSGAVAPSRRRRNPLSTRDRQIVRVLAGVGAASGAVVSTISGGLSPTGATVVDLLLTASVVSVTTWAAATAPWWVLVGAGGITAAFAGDPLGIVLGLAAVVIGAVIGARALNLATVRALAGLAVALGALRLDTPGPFGTETLAAAVVFAMVVTAGARRRSRRVRRTAAIVAGSVAGLAVVVTGFVGLTALTSRTALTTGNDLARTGLDALSVGDVAGAEVAFRNAASAFDRASGTLDQVWTRPGGLVPIVAQHRRAAVTLADGAALATAQLATTLSRLDLDAVRLVDGRIDLDAVVALEAPLLELQGTVDLLGEVVERAGDPWLVDAIARRLDDIALDVAERREQGEVALDAVRLAPTLLGADRPMVYFLAFVTPVEVRGSLGFMGNYAELTIDRGRIELTEFGRHTDLAEAGRRAMGDPPGWRIEEMDEFLSRYGRIGFANRPGGVASPQIWQIVTASPHFPSTAEVIAQLYPQSDGRPIDGVIALDTEVMAALLEFTGPIVTTELVEGLGEAGLEAIADLPPQIDEENALEFLLFDQYLLFEDDNPDRIDALELLSRETIDRLLAGALPGPVELGRVMGPLATGGHLAMWSPDDPTQALFGELGVDHSLPSLDGGDGVAIALNNASGNKIEVFLDVEAEYRREIDAGTGFLRGVLSVTFTNRAPEGGLPGYVIGNSVGLPAGWNRLLVGLYAPFPYNGATLDGEPIEMTLDVEQGWYVMGATIDIPPGGSRTVEIEFAGTLERVSEDLEPRVMLPNLASGAELTVTTLRPSSTGEPGSS